MYDNSVDNLSIKDFDFLRSSIEGELYIGDVRKHLLSTDAGIYEVTPIAVIYPKNTKDVVTTVNFARKYKITVHPRGAGSGLCGAAIGSGIIIDFTKYMNTLLSFSPEDEVFSCEPGYRYGELEERLKGTNLFFPPAPSSGEYASFGGMFATNAGGAYSVKYGNVADYLLDAEVVFADGSVRTFSDIEESLCEDLPDYLLEIDSFVKSNKERIINAYPSVPCNVCGYELRELAKSKDIKLNKLFGGAEGTLGIVTKLTFKLKPKPKYSTLIVAYFNNILNSAKAAQLSLTMSPASIEIMDKSLLNIALEHNPKLKGHIPEGFDNVLMIEFESDDLDSVKSITDVCTEAIMSHDFAEVISVAIDDEEKEKFWAVRKAAVPILYLLKGDRKIIPLVEDAAVPVDTLVEYFDGLYKIFNENSVDFVIYGHIAKGLLHARPLLNLKNKQDKGKLKTISDTVFNLIMKLGGTVSGEHGDGRIRSCYIPRQYETIVDAFIFIKQKLDPYNTLNPDIKTYYNDNQMALNLRYFDNYLGEDIFDTHLLIDGGFINEVEKCHGCSKCTTVTTATRMCPMYKIYRDENSAPKAKANILRGLISGKLAKNNIVLYDSTVQAVINRCVNCGSCSIECPSKVNIPLLAMEAKNHYVQEHGAKFKNILATKFDTFAKYTRKVFPIFKPFMGLTISKKIMQYVTGISSKREPINFAFNSVYDKYKTHNGKSNKKVLYFVGCYASYMRPSIAESTISILNKMGYEVIIPEQFCCGIPHISKGITKGGTAKIYDNIQSWGKYLDTVDHIVVSCSSCGLSLTKEWGYMLSGEVTKKIKSLTMHISELIDINSDKLKLDTPQMSIAYHTPCHMRLMPDPDATFRVLNKLNSAKIIKLPNSCCGMAGSWGMLHENYDESVLIAQKMINGLKKSNANICTTECPTCEMQLNHLSDTPIMHPAEIFDKLLN